MLIFVDASHQIRLDTRSKARRPIKVGIKGGGGRKRAETRTLLVYAAHQLTWCNVSLMRQAVSRTQMWVRARMPYAVKNVIYCKKITNTAQGLTNGGGGWSTLS